MEAWRSGNWKTYNGLHGFDGPWSLLLPPGWQQMNGKPLEEIAAGLGLTVKTSAPFTREAGDAANGVDRGLAAKLFAAKQGDVVTAPASGGHVVAQLTEIDKPEPLKPEELKALQDETRQALATDILRQFVSGLRQEIPVQTHQAVIDTLF
jgi:hypothetical protein